jgi:Xaa-Pro aminopeptidase
MTSRAEKLTFTEDTESYNHIPRVAPKLDRSRTKLTRGGTFRSKFGYGWGLGLGRKDKDKEDLFTEVDRSSSATTILPVYPRGEFTPSFVPDDARTPTRHMSQRSKNSYASKQSKDSQASRATKSSNLSGGSKRSNNSRSDSVNTLVGSALLRKENYQDPIRERTDTTARLAELRQLMAKDNLDY